MIDIVGLADILGYSKIWVKTNKNDFAYEDGTHISGTFVKAKQFWSFDEVQEILLHLYRSGKFDDQRFFNCMERFVLIRDYGD